MNLIVAVDQCWGIGYKGRLLYSIPEDMQLFKRMTEHKVVVMGLYTFQSLPGAGPLKNRVNIVLADQPGFTHEGVLVCYSLKQLFKLLDSYADEDIFVIGGQMVYELLLDYCSIAYITKVKSIATADRFFPDLDALSHWQLLEQSENKSDAGLCYGFNTYVNLNRARHDLG